MKIPYCLDQVSTHIHAQHAQYYNEF